MFFMVNIEYPIWQKKKDFNINGKVFPEKSGEGEGM